MSEEAPADQSAARSTPQSDESLTPADHWRDTLSAMHNAMQLLSNAFVIEDDQSEADQATMDRFLRFAHERQWPVLVQELGSLPRRAAEYLHEQAALEAQQSAQQQDTQTQRQCALTGDEGAVCFDTKDSSSSPAASEGGIAGLPLISVNNDLDPVAALTRLNEIASLALSALSNMCMRSKDLGPVMEHGLDAGQIWEEMTVSLKHALTPVVHEAIPVGDKLFQVAESALTVLSQLVDFPLEVYPEDESAFFQLTSFGRDQPPQARKKTAPLRCLALFVLKRRVIHAHMQNAEILKRIAEMLVRAFEDPSPRVVAEAFDFMLDVFDDQPVPCAVFKELNLLHVLEHYAPAWRTNRNEAFQIVRDNIDGFIAYKASQ
eukprot:gnl/Trimastix_PCT/5206.p1 GENE.gnl/Trimastix_PCT/5206~~gnl/Trimastix_PCT/5206.p1  ORF type:complete len:400 (+),score=92.70 gnl/Trimastix_PCT/5206:75-1202(+)